MGVFPLAQAFHSIPVGWMRWSALKKARLYGVIRSQELHSVLFKNQDLAIGLRSFLLSSATYFLETPIYALLQCSKRNALGQQSKLW